VSYLFSADDVRDALRELAQELRVANLPATIHVVGGAAVAIQIGRPALTRDVDALHPPSREFTNVVHLIAARRGWPLNWLNDAVKGFATHFDSADDWEPFDEGGTVTVFIARPRLLLAMKLLAARGTRDREDIERLLDACKVTSVATAVEIFDKYYPAEAMNHRAAALLREHFDDGNSLA
jgi:hypothetical protein